ncbi:hypothetical protein LRS74_28670 [Streptomyces sp. LX-29]|uniref:hypothetical protein n=1 Tax=Streptomyces sp. LX-29 TaxID=2900152 RepID=UPI00240CE4D2|nr:hypothetical protein [Streptomyces sp. LX-29]WFB10564.1 hypothetical protein LRS74_28670 [Streptomyces sp. LX-29]
MFQKSGSTGGFTRRFGGAAVVAVALAGAGVFVSAGPAAAGTNGQQLSVKTHYADNVRLCGDNQNGDWACTPAVNTRRDGWTDFRGYWWKGEVYVYSVEHTNRYDETRTATCWVPESQKGDWVFCNTGYRA